MTPTPLLPSLCVAPRQVLRCSLPEWAPELSRWGRKPVLIGGTQSLTQVKSHCPALGEYPAFTYGPDCCEDSLTRLEKAIQTESADLILGVGGGKALDTAKLAAFKTGLPIITIPTSGATCAAWTALGNIYSPEGAFLYDVPLPRCPDLLILDYDLILAAPTRTLVAGIGDAIAKWYEASVSSADSTDTLTIAAVQQARVLRDLLLQKSVSALAEPGGQVWREVVDATVLLAGVSGGLGGANCRTVGAHAVHNGLTQLPQAHGALHGEKVAYGILVQLRLEEMVASNQLALTARQQLLKFYGEIGLPRSLEDLGLGQITLAELDQVAQFTCAPQSDLHRLPFQVSPEMLKAALVSTQLTAPAGTWA